MNKENKWQVTGRVASNLIVVFAGVAFYMALSNFDALCEAAAEEGYIKAEDIERLKKFRANPSDESWMNH